MGPLLLVNLNTGCPAKDASNTCFKGWKKESLKVRYIKRIYIQAIEITRVSWKCHSFCFSDLLLLLHETPEGDLVLRHVVLLANFQMWILCYWSQWKFCNSLNCKENKTHLCMYNTHIFAISLISKSNVMKDLNEHISVPWKLPLCLKDLWNSLCWKSG